jgi:hypothetical protein
MAIEKMRGGGHIPEEGNHLPYFKIVPTLTRPNTYHYYG